MTQRNIFLSISLATTVSWAFAQKIASLEVSFPASTEGLEIPVAVNLDEVTFAADSSLVLFALHDGKKVAVACQVSRSEHRFLHWMTAPAKGGEKQLFELSIGKPSAFPEIQASRSDGTLTLGAGSKKELRYVYKTVYPPAGIDTAFRRSGFIHPLWSPHGQELTRIQAPDHYHHYGIWDPWTHVLFEGDTVDFWNLKSRKGTVRFAKFITIESGPVFAGFSALQEHVAFKKEGAEKIALNEQQQVRVFNPSGNHDYYFADILIELNCASESPFRILEYRYAGLGWRTTEKWNRDNSEVLTSDNKTRKDADGTTARWFVVQGALDHDYGGAVMISYPSNYNYPEPVRIWPENANPTGELFAMFAPTKNKDWLLRPGKPYSLRYRLLVFNGHFNAEKAEAAWHYFAYPPAVTIHKF